MQYFGECKTTGGKLVSVLLSVDENKITHAELRGDFFIHPEARTSEIIKAIQTQIESLQPTASIHHIASHLAAIVPFGVELIGTSPEAIAIAIARAVSGNADLGHAPALNQSNDHTENEAEQLAERWSKLSFDLIEETALSPAMNVALDELLLTQIAAGISPPTLRFWKWSSQAVIIGRCQSVENEVDLEQAKAANVTVVRRMTGGGAMFLQPFGAITYSLYLPESVVAGLTIRQSYAVCESWVIRGLRELGVDAHHVPINDIACSAGKIGGAAQARRSGVVLHHTTMAYDMNLGDMVKVLRIGREKLKDKAISSAQKRVSPLVLQTGKSREEIVRHLFQSFQRRFGGSIRTLTDNELSAAENLVAEKYGNPQWTYEI